MAGTAGAAETVASTYQALSAHLDERQRRLLLGVEARRLGLKSPAYTYPCQRFATPSWVVDV